MKASSFPPPLSCPSVSNWIIQHYYCLMVWMARIGECLFLLADFRSKNQLLLLTTLWCVCFSIFASTGKLLLCLHRNKSLCAAQKNRRRKKYKGIKRLDLFFHMKYDVSCYVIFQECLCHKIQYKLDANAHQTIFGNATCVDEAVNERGCMGQRCDPCKGMS